jgi:hypothetical protein
MRQTALERVRGELLSLSLEDLALLRRALDGEIYTRVQEARDAGLTWRELGEQLHVSMQEAHRRYRRPAYELTDGPDGIRAHARDSSLE